MTTATRNQPAQNFADYIVSSPLYAALPNNRERRRAIKKKLDTFSFAINSVRVDMPYLNRVMQGEQLPEKLQTKAVVEGIVFTSCRSVKESAYDESDVTKVGGLVKQGQPVVFDMATGQHLTGIHPAWLPDEYKITGIAMESIDNEDEDVKVKEIPVRLFPVERQAPTLLGIVVAPNVGAGPAIAELAGDRKISSGDVAILKILPVPDTLQSRVADSIDDTSPPLYSQVVQAYNLSYLPCKNLDFVEVKQDSFSGEYFILNRYHKGQLAHQGINAMPGIGGTEVSFHHSPLAIMVASVSGLSVNANSGVQSTTLTTYTVTDHPTPSYSASGGDIQIFKSDANGWKCMVSGVYQISGTGKTSRFTPSFPSIASLGTVNAMLLQGALTFTRVGGAGGTLAIKSSGDTKWLLNELAATNPTPPPALNLIAVGSTGQPTLDFAFNGIVHLLKDEVISISAGLELLANVASTGGSASTGFGGFTIDATATPLFH